MSSIYALSANYPLATLLSLLSALLARVNPEGKHPEGLKKFEARAALALEHAWRVRGQSAAQAGNCGFK